MIVVERTFAVPAAPDVVLAYLKDFANARDWDRSAQRTTRIGAGPHWRHARKFFGVTTELTYTLLEADAGRLVFLGRSEGATSTDTVTVRPTPGGAEVTYRVDLEIHGLAKLTTPLMRTELEKLATDCVTAVTAALGGTRPVADPARPRRVGAPTRLPTPAEETG